jgi:predicted enzyme related to lactoylglutathione lyase
VFISTDQKASAEFFGSQFGSERLEADLGRTGIYTLFKDDGNDLAAMMVPLTGYTRSRFPLCSGYYEVDDADACVTRIEELGDTTIAAPRKHPQRGACVYVYRTVGPPGCPMSPAAPPADRRSLSPVRDVIRRISW